MVPEDGGVTGVGVASVSQAVPVNPVLHWHVPEEEQVPLPLQSGDPGQSGVLQLLPVHPAPHEHDPPLEHDPCPEHVVAASQVAAATIAVTVPVLAPQP